MKTAAASKKRNPLPGSPGALTARSERRKNSIHERGQQRRGNHADRAARASSGWLTIILILLLAPVMSPAADAGESPAAGSGRKTIVVLGDSLAAGLGVDPLEAYPALLQQKIDATGWNYAVVNAGVSGDTSADGLSRIDWLLKRPMDVLILELGGNDGLRGVPVSATRTNLQTILDRVKQKCPQAQIIVTGMRMPPNLGRDYTSAFEKIYPELAARNHAALVPFLLEGVGGKPDLNQADRIHPTAEGQKIVADNVWKVLRPMLEKMNSE
jgi:acyl-CoA thioesterase I